MEDNKSDMTQEDQIQNCVNSYSGDNEIIGSKCGRPCKKPKLKIPKRGLGVAQLERIRVEEQQKKEEAIASLATLPSLSSVSSSKSSNLARSFQNFHHYNQPSFSPFSFPSGSSPGNGIVPEFWSSHGNDFEKKSFVVGPGLVFLPSLPHESNSNFIRPPPKWVPSTQQHQLPSSSLMVNASSGTSSTRSLQYSMEPPSNQNYMPLQKMIGMKRPYPFSQDVSTAPINLRLPIFAAPMKTNETSCGSGSRFNCSANATLREIPSSSTSNLVANSKRDNTVNESFNGNFLALAPPTPTSLCPPSKPKSPSTILAFHNQEYPHIDSLSYQGIIEDQNTLSPVFSGFNHLQHPFHIIPPVAKAAQIDHTSARIQDGNEVGESVDLNLKL